MLCANKLCGFCCCGRGHSCMHCLPDCLLCVPRILCIDARISSSLLESPTVSLTHVYKYKPTIYSLVGQLLIGYLDTSPTSEEDDSNDETKPSSSYLLGAIKSNNATTTASTASSSTQTGTVQTTRQTNNDTDEFPMPAPRLAAAVSALSVGSKDDSSKP